MKITGIIFAFFIMMFGAYFVVRNSMYAQTPEQKYATAERIKEVEASISKEAEQSYDTLMSMYQKDLKLVKTLREMTLKQTCARNGTIPYATPDFFWPVYADIQEQQLLAMIRKNPEGRAKANEFQAQSIAYMKNKAKSLKDYQERKAMKKLVKNFDEETGQLRRCFIMRINRDYEETEKARKRRKRLRRAARG